MKTSGHLVLYISENDDFDLWRILCRYSPEERAAVVKAALRKGLLTGKNFTASASTAEPRRASQSQAARQYPSPAVSSSFFKPRTAEAKVSGFVSPSPVAELALDDLGDDLIRSLSHDEIKDREFADLTELSTLLQPEESREKSAIPGLNFLLNNVIGEEDDENVVAYIKNLRSGTEAETKDKSEDDAG